MEANGSKKYLSIHQITENVGKINPPENVWKHFPSRNIPKNFNYYGHVYYHHLIESIEAANSAKECSDTDTVTPKAFEKKGRTLLDSGFIEEVHDNLAQNGDFCLIRAHVHHSMTNLLTLSVTCIISVTSGSINKATCTCKTSLSGRCAHIAALLSKLSDYVTCHGFIVQCSSTSKPCQWGKGKKRQKNPQPWQKSHYESAKRKQSDLYTYDPRPEELRHANRNLLNNFAVDLQTYGANFQTTPMWLTLFKYKYEDFNLDFNDIRIYKEMVNRFAFNLFQDMVEWEPTLDVF